MRKTRRVSTPKTTNNLCSYPLVDITLAQMNCFSVVHFAAAAKETYRRKNCSGERDIVCSMLSGGRIDSTEPY